MYIHVDTLKGVLQFLACVYNTCLLYNLVSYVTEFRHNGNLFQREFLMIVKVLISYFDRQSHY